MSWRGRPIGGCERRNTGDIVARTAQDLGSGVVFTEGIVSAVGRSVPEGNGVTLSSVIQTSAAINPGNSGGALVDLSGRVIGIPTLAALDPQLGSGQAPGIGFAIDRNTVRRVAGALIALALTRPRTRPAPVRLAHRAARRRARCAS